MPTALRERDQTMQQLPREEFQVSELPDDLGNPQILGRRRQAHVAFGIALTSVDLYWEDQSEKPDVMEAIWQAWDFFCRQEDEDVIVQYGRWGLDPDVVPRSDGNQEGADGQ